MTRNSPSRQRRASRVLRQRHLRQHQRSRPPDVWPVVSKKLERVRKAERKAEKKAERKARNDSVSLRQKLCWSLGAKDHARNIVRLPRNANESIHARH